MPFGLTSFFEARRIVMVPRCERPVVFPVVYHRYNVFPSVPGDPVLGYAAWQAGAS